MIAIGEHLRPVSSVIGSPKYSRLTNLNNTCYNCMTTVSQYHPVLTSPPALFPSLEQGVLILFTPWNHLRRFKNYR